MHESIAAHPPGVPDRPAERPNPDLTQPPIGDPLHQPLPGEQHDPLSTTRPWINEPRRSQQEDLLDGYSGPAEDDERFASIEPYQ